MGLLAHFYDFHGIEQVKNELLPNRIRPSRADLLTLNSCKGLSFINNYVPRDSSDIQLGPEHNDSSTEPQHLLAEVSSRLPSPTDYSALSVAIPLQNELESGISIHSMQTRKRKQTTQGISPMLALPNAKVGKGVRCGTRKRRQSLGCGEEEELAGSRLIART